MTADRPLAVAARMMDDVATAHGYVATLAEFGIDLAEIEYVAEQRALRMVLLKRNGEVALASWMHGSPITLSAEERELVELLTTMTVSGIIQGWIARGISDVRRLL